MILLLALLQSTPDTAAISRYVEAEMRRQQIPGLSVAVLIGDDAVLEGYGY